MTAMKVLFCLAIIFGAGTSHMHWKNSFNESFTFVCPNGESIGNMTSYHNSTYKDRRWYFECFETGATNDCHWSNNVNGFDKSFSFLCPMKGVVTGISGNSSSTVSHRRLFSFYCCSWPGTTIKNCTMLPVDRDYYEGYFNFELPYGKVLTGVSSAYSNYNEIMTEVICKILRNLSFL